MIELLAVVLGKIVDAFLTALNEKVSDEIWAKIHSDPTKKAIKQALGSAIQRYATSDLRLDLAHALLQKDSFVTLPAVASELTQLVRFDREPNAELIGQMWKTSMDNPPSWCDFTSEAKRLLECLRVELRNTEIFRPVFDAKSLDAIASSAASSAQSLVHMEAELTNLTKLKDTGLSNLPREASRDSSPLREQIRDYSRYIDEKTRDFVGREFVFDAMDSFINTYPCGYFFVQGDPGIGKSSLAAWMVKTRGYIHHFNIQSTGINTAEKFLRNICAQLIVRYQLNYSSLSAEAMQDGGFLEQLLREVSEKLGSHRQAIIVIDALDEVDKIGLPSGPNLLYLPRTLPQGIYMVVTMRRIEAEQLNLSIDDRKRDKKDTLEIEHKSASNTGDIQKYVTQAVGRPGIQAYIAAQEIDDELFVEHLVEKSEGNFMYLHYVLPEIEDGYYTDIDLEALPAGLQNYYMDHWRRMRGKDEDEWFKYKLPVIMALTIVKEPVSIDLIVHFSRVTELTRIRNVLRDWIQFLHVEQVPYEGILQDRYYIYHTSFHEFIRKMEEVEDERVSLREAQQKIITRWKEVIDE